ncbi:MAG: hypothetical protein GEU99_09030 [Luteitalea sp.]|nr:hypothetical protein [Luteitalea sp.]
MTATRRNAAVSVRSKGRPRASVTPVVSKNRGPTMARAQERLSSLVPGIGRSIETSVIPPSLPKGTWTVLDAARTRTARLFLVTTPSFTVARAVVGHARRLNQSVRLVARAEGFDAFHALRELGVSEVVQPEFEAGLEMTRTALAHLGVSPEDTLRVADAVREERYGKGDTVRG